MSRGGKTALGTTGEMLPEDKNAISHRGLAIRRMVEILKEKGDV